MMLFDSKKISLAINIFCMCLGALIACLGIFCHEEFILFICVTLGICIIFVNALLILFYIKMIEVSKFYIYHLVCAIINVGMGILFIINHGLAVSIVFGCYLILFPIVRIIVSDTKKAQALKEIPYFILGVLMLFNVNDIVFKVAIIVFGSALIILGIVNIIISNRPVKTEPVDDGIIDITYRDL